jgi:hypothetical protein
MTADADIRDLVAMFFCAGINMTGAPHLYALLNVRGLSRLLQSISYQPGDGAARCRPRGRILTQGINATSAQPNHCIARIAGQVEEVRRRRFRREIRLDSCLPRLQCLQYVETIQQHDDKRQTRRNSLNRCSVTDIRWTDPQKIGDSDAIVDFPEHGINLLHLAKQLTTIVVMKRPFQRLSASRMA